MTTGPFSFDTPNTPPTAKDDDLSFLRLIRSRRVGPATFHRLITEQGSVAAALAALPEIARSAGLEGYETCPEATAEAELRAGRRVGARFLRCDHPDYPPALRQIDGAPPVLWIRGDARWLQGDPFAVIGARNASSLGLRMARGMAAGLGEAGHCVVAGLARGIDTAAHNAALPTGTVAVMAGGIDQIYPAENAILAAQIAEMGALVSEQAPGVEPAARHFPARNRIISGLSRAVVVIEAAHRSGSLITAKNALDQGREVMAVPGHPMDARAAGCNALIRDGAALVRCAADVIAVSFGTEAERKTRLELPESKPVTPRPSLPNRACDSGGPAGLEARIMNWLSPSPSDEDDLIRRLGVPASVANSAILSLELQGMLTRLAGGRLARN
ncbi:DNA-processing protein DprA [Paracoccus zhejiangensis]|uniref:DNA-protecting protein DprA n=1 Tax=Paracoccus zhejiangensis TaxID=1077935 RepID=A0A2H5EZD8_9RHOB|nr:DNA-processing protein DprA [Paracoccus zhejiangensis]AUH64666.1 DNA-protecting protein DprA [Paracoccus zhejiangensis]